MNEILQKLKVKAPHLICKLNAPSDFEKELGKLPHDIKISTSLKTSFDSLHWFVKTKSEVDKKLTDVIKNIKPHAIVWCYYPKGTSTIQTDLTRDKGWESLLKNEDIKRINLISFNETWSAFSFRLKTEKDRLEKKPVREIFKYADPKTKTISFPDDVAKAFSKNKKASAIFNTLAFTNRKEYIEWIITAKLEVTRKARIDSTLKKLIEGKKNPSQK